MFASRMLLCCVSSSALMSGSAATAAELAPAVRSAAASVVSDQAGSAPASGPATNQNDEQTGDEVLVTAQRQQEQRDTKRNSLQVVDAIGRTAIDDNPARSVADLIRQVPGIAIENDQGEPRNPRIRGLGYVQTTLDGREVLMAGARNLDVGDVGVDLLQGIEVYKTPSANMVEGGMSGLINLKLRQPLSYDGFHANALLTGIYDEHSRKVAPSGDIVVGNRWDTGAGPIGLVAGIGAVTNHFRNEYSPISGYGTTTTAFDLNRNGVLGDPGDAVSRPSYFGGRYMQGLRERYTANVQFEWQPAETLDIHASYFALAYRDSHYHYVINVNAPATNSTALSTQFTLVPGTTNRIASGSYADAAVNTQGFYAPTRRYLHQGSVGADWQPADRLKLSLNADYTFARAKGDLEILTTSATAPRLNVTGVGTEFRFDTPGLDVTNPAQFTIRPGALFENRYRQYSTQWVQRADADYEVGDGPLRHVQIGARLTQRNAHQIGGGRGSTPASSSTATYAGNFGVSWDGYLTQDGFTPSRWFGWDPYKLTNFGELRTILGTPQSDPPYQPSQDFRFREKTYAGYARALYDLSLGSVEADGDVGLRVVRTETRASGFVTSSNGAISPTSRSAGYTNWLPSATLRFKLTSKVNLRFSGSKTVTRPDFGDLAPGITLDVTSNQGSAGNPALTAFTSKGADATLEWYHSAGGFAYTAAFYKKLNGFIQRTSALENFNGSPFLVSRPFNGGTASVRGFEIGANERLVFLPGVLKNLGIDANFTYVDGKQSDTSPFTGDTLLNASKYTYNVSGYFEYQKLSLRLNYSGRSHMLINQSLPESFTMQDWLDFSARYRLSSNIELIGNATNLGTPLRHSYYLNPDLPLSISRPLRRFEVGVRVRL